MNRATRYIIGLCEELDNNAREISFRMLANGGPTPEEAIEVVAYMHRQRAILTILENRLKKK